MLVYVRERPSSNAGVGWMPQKFNLFLSGELCRWSCPDNAECAHIIPRFVATATPFKQQSFPNQTAARAATDIVQQ